MKKPPTETELCKGLFRGYDYIIHPLVKLVKCKNTHTKHE